MRGLFGAMARPQFKTVDASDLTWTALLGHPSSKAGVAVDVDTAIRVTTVFSCCRALAEGIAQPPLNLFEVVGNSRKLAVKNPLFKILALRPNDFMTSFEFRETMMYHAVMTGNAFALIGRGGTKRSVQELLPIYSPVRVLRDKYFNVSYLIDGPDGQAVEYGQEDVFHLRGPSWNGYLGMDAVRLARESIGLAIATEETHGRLFSNGARPGGVLSIEGQLSKENREALKQRIAEMQEGLHNNFKTLVLDQSAKWSSMAMSGVDAQHLDTRRFQIEEICRAMRVFPQMVMHSDKTSTFASAEQFFVAHVVHSLGPWFRRWEEKIGHSLLNDNDGMEARFATAALMFGDAQQRSTYYQNALGGARGETAYMTRNEVRWIEGALLGIALDPIEGGDALPTPTPPAKPIQGPDKTPDAPHLQAPGE